MVTRGYDVPYVPYSYCALSMTCLTSFPSALDLQICSPCALSWECPSECGLAQAVVQYVRSNCDSLFSLQAAKKKGARSLG